MMPMCGSRDATGRLASLKRAPVWGICLASGTRLSSATLPATKFAAQRLAGSKDRRAEPKSAQMAIWCRFSGLKSANGRPMELSVGRPPARPLALVPQVNLVFTGVVRDGAQ